MSEGTAPTGELRASDAERERAASTLRDHAATGRLDMNELAERLEVAYSARTRSQLARLLADLPRPREDARRPAFEIHRHTYLLVAAALIAVWAVTGAGYFWPVWPLLGWGIGLCSHGRACGAARMRPRRG